MPILRRLGFFLLAAQLILGQAVAQPSSESPSTPELNLTNLVAPGYLETRLGEATNRADLTEELRSALARFHKQSIASRNELQDLNAEQARLIRTADTASNLLQRANERLAGPDDGTPLDIPEDASAQALEQQLSELQAELQLAQAELERLDREPKRRADRKVRIAELLAEYRGALKALEDAEASDPDRGLPAEFGAVARDAALLEKAVYLRRIQNLNLELASYGATSDLLLAQQALAGRRVQSLKEQLSLLKQAATERRAAESSRAAEAARVARQRAEAINLPVITALAETNQALARQRITLAGQLDAARDRLDAIEEQWTELQAGYDSVREQVQIVQDIGVGQNFAIGMALREEQYSLPSRGRQQTEIRQRMEAMARARLDFSDLRERRRDFANLEPVLSGIRASLPEGMPEAQREEAMAECRRLLNERRTLLGDLASDHSTLVEALAKLNQVQEGYLATIDQFQSYISERVLWIQSTDSLSLPGIRNDVGAIRRVLAEELRDGLWPYLKADWNRHPVIYWGALMLLLALLAVRVPLARGLQRTCPDKLPEGRLSLRPAALALLYTALLTLPLPALLIFLGWRLEGHSGTTELAGHWTHGFYVVGGGVVVVEFLRQACRRPGLALAHLRWPLHNVRLVRLHFGWFLAVGVPLAVLTDVFEGVFVPGLSNRLFFIVGQLLILLLGHWMLRPATGLRFSAHDGRTGTEGPLRFQRLYHGVALGIPVTLILMSALGYTYTARQFWIRVADSIQWGLVVLVVTLFVLHWLTVMRRRLAVSKVEHRKALEEDKQTPQQAGPDIWQVYTASRRLFSSLLWIVMAIGLYMIWSDMLPALKKLDRTPIPLLNRGTDGTSFSADVAPGVLQPAGRPQEEPAPGDPPSSESTLLAQPDFVSVGDLLAAVLVLLLTFVAGRNLPGFMEMVLLSRLRFRQGEGYAIVTVLRYVVLVIGIGWALGLIGISWNKVQWLAAAITVGIGFGLQEIFANFVSGLILLFERPVRIGDVITVGDVTGTITRIQMRATTVRNWDQQELVLPNKDLVTGRVINWTLSNDVSRLAITVGVSYQADVKRASELLLRIAKENPNVRSDPAPFVTFDEFGDSTLNLVLRAYVSIEVRLNTRSQINHAILERFREAGIEIAYPQRDLHLRSVTADLPALSSAPTGKRPSAS